MLKACGCGEEGTRLSQPQCPMAWENSPELGEKPWVGKWSVGGQRRPTAEMPLPSAVSQLGPRSPQTVPFQGRSPGGAVWQMPPTDVAPEAHAASFNTTSVRGGQQHPWYLTHQVPGIFVADPAR